MAEVLVVAVLAAILFGSLGTKLFHRVKRSRNRNYPPIVNIPAAEILNNPRAAYEAALRQFGPVVGVRRKGRLEYIVDETLTSKVLTSDASFSFEEGTATVLNLHFFFFLSGSFFHDMDDLVQNGINAHLDDIIERIFPVFLRYADSLREDRKGASIDVFDHAHRCIAEAMTIVTLGDEYVNDRNLKIIIKVAGDIATLTGIYQNTSVFGRTFPRLWKVAIWLRVLSTSIFTFFRVVGPRVWRDIQRTRNSIDEVDAQSETLVAFLARKCAKADDSKWFSSFMSFLWVMSLLLGLIFASVHQTASVAVWILFELSMKPKYLKLVRDELDANTGVLSDLSDVGDALKKAKWLDAFIREVLRSKGDTLSTCRRSTEDVPLGGLVIPKGHLVIPLATLSHANEVYYGSDAAVFKPERWLDDDKYAGDAKPAVMGSQSYFPFGLGRWACPGRYLAIAEIKMIVWCIIAKSNPKLQDNKYRIIDKLNITSVPPDGRLILESLPIKQK